MNERAQRGLELAETVRIQPVGKGVPGRWIVPSATSPSVKYVVDMNSNAHRCTCPDYELRRCNCKHVFAMQAFVKRTVETVTDDQGTTTVTETVEQTVKKVKKTVYRQDWPAYNAAQTSEKATFQILLHQLCEAVPEPTPAAGKSHGRPRLPYSDMVFSAAFKVFSTVSTRRFMCDMADAHGKGYVSRVPHFNSILNYLEMEELTPILHALIERSAAPLRCIEQDFAVDSTGFSGSKFDTWSYTKYNADRLDFVQHCERADWLKLHLMCGVKTNIVTSVEVSGRDSNDCPFLKPLVKKAASAGFKMKEVSADKAYLSRANMTAIVGQHAVPFIPFKINSTAAGLTHSEKPTAAHDLWLFMWRYFTYHTNDFLAHYHKRSNVESTFSMIKAKFGNAVRSKGRTAQINEVLCKVLCHNICCVVQSIHELGIEGEFKEKLALAA